MVALRCRYRRGSRSGASDFHWRRLGHHVTLSACRYRFGNRLCFRFGDLTGAAGFRRLGRSRLRLRITVFLSGNVFSHVKRQGRPQKSALFLTNLVAAVFVVGEPLRDRRAIEVTCRRLPPPPREGSGDRRLLRRCDVSCRDDRSRLFGRLQSERGRSRRSFHRGLGEPELERDRDRSRRRERTGLREYSRLR